MPIGKGERYENRIVLRKKKEMEEEFETDVNEIGIKKRGRIE